MSSHKPLMPKATAVWLVENTSLSFEQIAEFCGLHVLEVKGIADGDVAHGIKGLDPISSGQLTREEIKRAEEDPEHHLELAERKIDIGLFRFLERSFEIDRKIRVDRTIDIFNARVERFDYFARRNLALTQQSLQVGDIERRQIGAAHSTTFVTMNRLFAWRGALLSASLAVKQSRGSRCFATAWSRFSRPVIL